MTEPETKHRELAGTAWCFPETSSIEMDVRLGEAFAAILAAFEQRVMEEERARWVALFETAANEESYESRGALLWAAEALRVNSTETA